MNIAFPYRYDGRGRTAEVDGDRHIRDLIEQLLFTAPGERVNRATFGCGLAHLVFEPLSGELATATQMLVQGALTEWLGDLIQLEDVQITAEESTLRIVVAYTVRRTQERRVESFAAGAGAP